MVVCRKFAGRSVVISVGRRVDELKQVGLVAECCYTQALPTSPQLRMLSMK